LNERPKWKFPRSGTGARFGFVLVLIALAAAIPRIWLGSFQFVEYDGYWHVFIAQQDNWGRFWHDVYVNAHPPLYFLLLKAVLHLGHSFLLYRGISLTSGILSVGLIGLIAFRVTHSRARAYQTALAYGLAMPGIIVSCEVRSYMLSVFFVLGSFWFLLATSGAADAPGEGKARTGFAAGAILACLSHYFAFFYAGAAMLLLTGRLVVRKLRRQPASWIVEIATSLPIAASIATLYFAHAHLLAEIQGHLLPFYFDKGGHETVAAFLIRNWKNLLDWFSPASIPVPAALGLLALALIAGFLSVRADRRAGRFPWTFPITAIMLGAIALAGVAGKYPFGGDLRQQFLLFPFFILCAAVFVEAVVPAMAAVPHAWRVALNSLAAIAIAWVSAVAFMHYPKVSSGILSDRMALFDQLEPHPTAVYLDQFNLITFFIYHDQWRWKSIDPPHPIPGVDVYRLTRGRETMMVFRDTTEWNLEPEHSDIYAKIAECLRSISQATGRIPGISVFSVRQTPPAPPFSDLQGLSRDIVTHVSDSAMCVQKLKVTVAGWYGTFRHSGCAPLSITPRQLTGTFDDGNPDIDYFGVWTHASFAAAAGGSVSFSNLAQSSASVAFEGTSITWIYTKAFNRGIGAVKIDGVPQGELDQYSPKIEWQSRTVYGNLPRGWHKFEVAVTGRKRGEATDRYVDVDGFVVR
jgi:hypothetical protein